MTKGHIYVAGPLYGSGHQDDNIRVVLETATRLRQLGYTPFVPHLYFFWNLIYRHHRDFWLGLDRDWLRKCDAMLRIGGESPGSSIEEVWANEFGIPWTTIAGPAEVESGLIVIRKGVPLESGRRV